MGRNAGREWLAIGGVGLGEGRSAGAGGRLALAFHAIEARRGKSSAARICQCFFVFCLVWCVMVLILWECGLNFLVISVWLMNEMFVGV